jgi:hypothetical protein
MLASSRFRNASWVQQIGLGNRISLEFRMQHFPALEARSRPWSAATFSQVIVIDWHILPNFGRQTANKTFVTIKLGRVSYSKQTRLPT